MKRRHFLQAVAGSTLMRTTLLAAASSSSQATGWSGYADVTAIDLLATPGPFNTLNDFAAPLTPEMLRNALASGISAVNLSLEADTLEDTFKNIAYWERELDAHPEVLWRVRTHADVRAVKKAGRLGLIYGFQGTRMIGSDLDRLDLFSRFGVRIVQLTYNGRELLGDGCLERANAGLSRLGFQAVERLNALRTLIDLSHCGQRTTAEAIVHSKAPVAITHSGCQALADRPRNKRDDELRLMADRGGVLGIYLMPFLTMGTQPTADDVVRHIEHAIRVCGEDHVGIGSDCSITPLRVTDDYRRTWHDFVSERMRLGIAAPGEDPNVFPFVPDFNTPRRLELIAQRLSAAGHRSTQIEKVIGGNWIRLLSEVWGERASAASTGASPQALDA